MIFYREYLTKQVSKKSYTISLPPPFTKICHLKKGTEIFCYIDNDTLVYSQEEVKRGVFIRKYKVHQCGNNGLGIFLPPSFCVIFGVKKRDIFNCYLTNKEIVYRLKEK